jgi:hypothetical protein
MTDSSANMTYFASYDPYGVPIEQFSLNSVYDTNLGFTKQLIARIH